jgi:hypothetical protein
VNLSKREQVIGTVAGAALGLWFVNWAVVSTLLTQREDALASVNKAELELTEARNLIKLKPALDRQFAENVSKGLMVDQSQAESQLLNRLREWASDSGLDLATLKPSGIAQPVMKPGGKAGEKHKSFLRLTCRATGTGNMNQVARFIWRIQNGSIPVRITDLTINTRKEGTDDLEVNLGISTIFLAPAPQAAQTERRPASQSSTRPAPATTPTTRREARP